MERRRFIKTASLLAGWAALNYVLPKISYAEPSKTALSVYPDTIWDVFGLRDAPHVGGSRFIDQAIQDFQNFGIKFLVSSNPLDMLTYRAKESGIMILSRREKDSWDKDDSRYKENELLPVILNLRKHYGPNNFIVIPYNEVNLQNETQEIYIRKPFEHIVTDFAPAVRLIALNGGKAALTPIAPGAEIPDGEGNVYDKATYVDQMLQALAQTFDSGFIRKNIVIADNSYIFSPDQDPIEGIKKINDLVKKNLGVELPIYVTEGGLNMASERIFSDEVYAQTILKILDTPIPQDLQHILKSYCFWIYANEAQRTLDLKQQPWDMELNAWVKPDGYTLTARMVAERQQFYKSSSKG